MNIAPFVVLAALIFATISIARRSRAAGARRTATAAAANQTS
jgi:hypothetical protein